MPFDADELRAILRSLRARHGRPQRLRVAYSGGRDSSVLLHALVAGGAAGDLPVSALHVHHGLQPAADDWQAHCQAQAAVLGVPLRVLAVDVGDAGGPEAAARTARYAALERELTAGDWLLSAHHEDDQAETLLLNLMRGTGVAGLRGIAPYRTLGAGLLLRPLLNVPGADLAGYAARHDLRWIDDPSNAETRFDRNYLRWEVMPALNARWPGAAAGLARSAALAGEAAALLDELAAQDIDAAGTPARLDTRVLGQFGDARRRNLLRHACGRLGLPTPPARQLERIGSELLPARDDAAPLLTWPGAEARRYRGLLYLLGSLEEEPAAPPGKLAPERPLELGHGLGRLVLEPGGGGLAADTVAGGLSVRFRDGGETLRPHGRLHRRPLKKLLQEAGVVPWMRARIPLLYRGATLVAAGDLWIAAKNYDRQGYRLRWEDRPALD